MSPRGVVSELNLMYCMILFDGKAVNEKISIIKIVESYKSVKLFIADVHEFAEKGVWFFVVLESHFLTVTILGPLPAAKGVSAIVHR